MPTGTATIGDERAPAPVLARSLAVFASIFVTGALGLALPRLGAGVALPLLPSGIAVAALVRWGRGLWPAVLLAELAIDLAHGRGAATSLIVSLGLPAGAWVTTRVLAARGFDPTFAHARDVPLFIIAAAIGMALPPTAGVLGFAVGGPAAGNTIVDWLRWWSNTTAGVLLVAPLLISARRDAFERLRAPPLAGLAFATAVVLVAAAPFAIATIGVAGNVSRPPLVAAALVLVVVGAIRFGLALAAATVLVLSLTVALGSAFNRGLLHDVAPLQGLVAVWTYGGGMTVIVLTVTALLAERDAAATAGRRAERRYAEVFESSPQPLWVHDAATLRLRLVNRATERQYGYSREELLRMRISDLAAPGETQPVPAAECRDGEPFETRHLSRDGRLLEIQMWTRPIDFGGESAVLVFATDATERKALGRAVIGAIASEQRRIGEDIHDGLGQELTGLALSMRALATRANRERLAVAADLDELATQTAACIRSARHIVRGLSPLTGVDGNLAAALQNLADASIGIDVRVTTRLEAPLTLPLEARTHLLRIAQEALQNAQKHADARRIDIELAVGAETVRLAVVDDGRGLPDQPDFGVGMRTMEYRAAAIHGRLSIRPRTPCGTIVACDAPQSTAARAAAVGG